MEIFSFDDLRKQHSQKERLLDFDIQCFIVFFYVISLKHIITIFEVFFRTIPLKTLTCRANPLMKGLEFPNSDKRNLS